jgi:spectinomycin phosphotransferase
VEINAFFTGYGEIQVEPVAITYFREERIIQDIVADCDLLLAGEAGDDDRTRALGFLRDNFGPEGLIAVTRRADRAQQS